MYNETFEKLAVLNEKEILDCNGGSVLALITKEEIPSIVFPIPKRDSENRL